ncbi:MAG: hypothetical protein ACK4JY_03890 [Brevundimonas sp.]|uniref:hypothetical protein n=1 Tax=Brevundimonas sp. TaxID=1871086 RepID=UPI00391D3FF1
MPAKYEPAPPVTPADLPRDALITYDQFAWLMAPHAPQRATIEKSARKGDFVPGIRMTARSPMLFRAGAVADFLAARMAGLDAMADVVPLGDDRFTFASTQQVNAAPVDLNALIDSLNRDSSDAEVDVVARAIVADDPAVDYRSATFARFRKALGMAGPPAMKMMITIRREVGAGARA